MSTRLSAVMIKNYAGHKYAPGRVVILVSVVLPHLLAVVLVLGVLVSALLLVLPSVASPFALPFVVLVCSSHWCLSCIGLAFTVMVVWCLLCWYSSQSGCGVHRVGFIVQVWCLSRWYSSWGALAFIALCAGVHCRVWRSSCWYAPRVMLVFIMLCGCSLRGWRTLCGCCIRPCGLAFIGLVSVAGCAGVRCALRW